jgi:hypothetical protein
VITTKDIQNVVCKKFGITLNNMQGVNRARHLVVPRQIAMYLAREVTNESWCDLGQKFCRDHTSVTWAWDRVSARLELDAQFRSVVNEILFDLQLPGGLPPVVLKEPKPLHTRKMEAAMRRTWRAQAAITNVPGGAD